MSLKKFLVKHAGELASIAGVVETVVGLLPVGRQDKANIRRVTNDLKKASKNIAKSAKKMADDNSGKVTDARLKAIVESMLPNIIEQVADKVFDLSKKNDQEKSN